MYRLVRWVPLLLRQAVLEVALHSDVSAKWWEGEVLDFGGRGGARAWFVGRHW
jgi:hypothetical protein